MRILHVIDSLELAGAETLVKDLVLRSSSRGLYAETYILRASDTALGHELRTRQATIHVGQGRSLYDPSHIWSLADHIRRHTYDLVHVHLFPAQLWAAAARRLLQGSRPALVTTEHGTKNRRRMALFRPLDRWMYAQYDLIACISRATKDKLVAWLPELAGRTPVVFNGVDVRRFAEADPLPLTSLGIRGGPVVMCVARLELEKGHDALIRAVARMEAVLLVLVGQGRLGEHLARLARNLGAGGRVHFLGRRTDVPRLLKTASVYVQPSRWEGFGIAALEAMAAGLPVVASDVPGLSDIVADAGVLVPPDDPSALVRALQGLLVDPARRREVASRCARRAQDFDISATVEAYDEMYRFVMDRRAGREG